MAVLSPREERRLLKAQEREEWRQCVREWWPVRHNFQFRSLIRYAVREIRRG